MIGWLYGSKWFACRFQEIFLRSTLSRSFPLSRHLAYHHHHRRRRHPHHHLYCQHHQHHHCIMALMEECPTDQKLCWYVKNVKIRAQMLKIEQRSRIPSKDSSNANIHTFVQKCGNNTSFTVFFSKEKMDKSSYQINI